MVIVIRAYVPNVSLGGSAFAEERDRIGPNVDSSLVPYL